MGLAQDLIEAGIFDEIEAYERDADKYSPGGTTYMAKWGGRDGDCFTTLPHKHNGVDDFAAQALEDMKEWIQTSQAFAEKTLSETQKYQRRIRALGV